MDSIAIYCVALTILLALSAFFSATETSLTSISKIKIKAMLDDNIKGAKSIEKLMRDEAKFLSTVLIGNNLVNVTAAALATSIAIKISGSGLALGISTAVVTVFILIVGEITPKTIAVKNPTKIARFVSKPMLLLMIVFAPVSAVLNLFLRMLLKSIKGKTGEETSVTETEIKAMVDAGHDEGVIKEEEKNIINNIFDMDSNCAKDVMTPRTDMAAVEVGESYANTMEMFMKKRFSRLLIYKEDADHIVGIVHLKDIAFLNDEEKENFETSKYMRAPVFSYEYKPTDRKSVV